MSQVLQAGDAVGRFVLEERLDDFGLGEVWRARDEKFRNRPVVVKLLRAVEGDELPEALDQHLDALRGLRHPLVLPVIHHGVAAQRAYIAQEHFEGPSLGTLLDRSRAARAPMPLPRLLAIFSAVCAAVESGHTADPPLVHGALSPASVLVGGTDDEPVVRLLDTGLGPYAAPLAAPRDSARSAPCKAPEQYAKEPITSATDVFSLGLLLMEMLAASNEARATSPVLWRYVGRDDVPDTIWDAILGATKQAPAERYETPTKFVDALADAWARAADEEAAEGAGGVPAAIAPAAPVPASPEPAAPEPAAPPAAPPPAAPMPAPLTLPSLATALPALPLVPAPPAPLAAPAPAPAPARVPLSAASDDSTLQTMVSTPRAPAVAPPPVLDDDLVVGERTQVQEGVSYTARAPAAPLDEPDLSAAGRTVMLDESSLPTNRPRVVLSTVDEESTIVKGRALTARGPVARPAPAKPAASVEVDDEIHMPESRTVMMESVGFWSAGPRASSVPPPNPDDSSARATNMYSKRRLAQMSSLSKMVTGLDELRLGDGPIAMPKLAPVAPAATAMPALPQEPAAPPAKPAAPEPPRAVTTMTLLLAVLLLAVALWALTRG